jgi:hypothetical protein
MASIAVAATILFCLLLGALAGIGLRGTLPKHHLDSDTRDLIKLGVGLIGTMSALVLGLLVASTKGAYDTKKSELAQMAGNAILLDQVLAHYGTDATDTREALRGAIAGMVGSSGAGSHLEDLSRAAPISREGFFDKIQALTPQTEAQRALLGEAKSLAMDLAKTRWLIFAQSGTSISTPFLVIVVFWLTILYTSFGLFAPRNPTALLSLLVSAAAVAGAMFLILDLDHPFTGLLAIPDSPLRNALAALGS